MIAEMARLQEMATPRLVGFGDGWIGGGESFGGFADEFELAFECGWDEEAVDGCERSPVRPGHSPLAGTGLKPAPT